MRLWKSLWEQLLVLGERNGTSGAVELRRAAIAHLCAADPPLWPLPGEGSKQDCEESQEGGECEPKQG